MPIFYFKNINNFDYYFFFTSIHFMYQAVILCSYKDSNLELLVSYPNPISLELHFKVILTSFFSILIFENYY